MKTAKATYNAPRGDSKVVEMCGVTFFDGKEVELNSDEHGHLMTKLPGNQHFTFEAGEDQPDVKPAKRGRPSNADKAAAEAAKAAESPAVTALPTVQPVP